VVRVLPGFAAQWPRHYQLQFAVLPPLIIDALPRIIGRGSAFRNGIWLGLLVAAQLFIGGEMLIFTTVAGMVLAVVLAVSRPRAVPARPARRRSAWPPEPEWHC
jgi:hypothetical protein